MSLIGRIHSLYRGLTDNITERYESTYGLPCEVFFPLNKPNPNSEGNYDDINLFATHGIVPYPDTPNVTTNFYIPGLFREEIMNSPEDYFDTFYSDDAQYTQPYIETTYSRELPIMSKVVVTIHNTKMYYMIERKTIVPLAGAGLLKMYLIPMTGEVTSD